MRIHNELDTVVAVTLDDGPFGSITILSAPMQASEAAMTATHFKVGDTFECKITNVALRAMRSRAL
jgi:hypothetical protein